MFLSNVVISLVYSKYFIIYSCLCWFCEELTCKAEFVISILRTQIVPRFSVESDLMVNGLNVTEVDSGQYWSLYKKKNILLLLFYNFHLYIYFHKTITVVLNTKWIEITL